MDWCHDARVLRWMRFYFDEDDVWYYFEVGPDGDVHRQVEVQGATGVPITAASWDELAPLADVAAVQTYEATYGMLAQVPIEPDILASLDTITLTEFEQHWSSARRHLEQASPPRQIGQTSRPGTAKRNLA